MYHQTFASSEDGTAFSSAKAMAASALTACLYLHSSRPSPTEPQHSRFQSQALCLAGLLMQGTTPPETVLLATGAVCLTRTS